MEWASMLDGNAVHGQYTGKIMIVGIHHIAIGVPDFDKGLSFYRDLLGFEVVQESTFDRDNPMADRAIGLPKVAARMAMLKAANAFIELWQYTNPPSDDRRGRPCERVAQLER